MSWDVDIDGNVVFCEEPELAVEICLECGVRVTVDDEAAGIYYDGRDRAFCSPLCRQRWHEEHCRVCGKKLEACRLSDDYLVCSLECYSEYMHVGTREGY